MDRHAAGRADRGIEQLTRAASDVVTMRISALLLSSLLTVRAIADPAWVVDPQMTGPDLPPQGRSLFDHLVARDGKYQVPFPFEAMIAMLERQTSQHAYLDRPVKSLLIPLGRSLQRDAAAPHYFRSPRAVIAIDGEPADDTVTPVMLLRDRLYLGYMEDADVLEVISYNEAAGRFEFQVVRDFRDGGAKEVSYAPRALCMSCHQNAAPIFARPLWDETNANRLIAQFLGKEGKDFYGIPIEQAVDVAYAIDSATDRANEFALTQQLWQDGCGPGQEGKNCRGALLIGALQLALTGGRDFAKQSAAFMQNAVQRMRQIRSQRWPEGLRLPNPDIPNRIPLKFAALASTSSLQGVDLRSDIPARFEPLSPRSAKALWNPDDIEWTEAAVRGVLDFIAKSDIQRLDQFLLQQPAQERRLTASCQIKRTTSTTESKLKIQCAGDKLTLRGRVVVGVDGLVSGRLAELELEGNRFGSIAVSGQQINGRLRLVPQHDVQQPTPRLADGTAIASLAISPTGADVLTADLLLTLRDDFAPVRQVVQKMLAINHDAIIAKPFRRAVVLKGLFDDLGIPVANWCCHSDDHLPAPQLIAATRESDLPAFAPFYQVCAACHRSAERFPPNFLAGSDDEVATHLIQCGERIKYRLGMWALDPGQRPKTPMPPQHELASLGSNPQDWASSELLASLQDTLERLVANHGEPLPTMASLLARDYTQLKTCLPNEHDLAQRETI